MSLYFVRYRSTIVCFVESSKAWTGFLPRFPCIKKAFPCFLYPLIILLMCLTVQLICTAALCFLPLLSTNFLIMLYFAFSFIVKTTFLILSTSLLSHEVLLYYKLIYLGHNQMRYTKTLSQFNHIILNKK